MAENRTKTTEGVLKAAGLLVVSNFLASILGYVRSIIISSYFGLGIENDAYVGAFTIPDFLYTLLVGGGISAAFIPVFSAYIAEKNYKDAYRMGSSILNLVAICSIILCIVGEVFTPQLLSLIIDFSKGGEPFFTLTVKLTRIMFFQCFFMCLVGICMGILQSYKDFLPPSIGSVVYNITIITVGLILMKLGLGIAGFSIGVVCGAAIHLIIQLVSISKKGFEYQSVIDMKHEGVRRFLHLFWPMLLGVSVTQLNSIVNKYFGSSVGPSILSAMQNAMSLMQLPINIFGYSIAMSVFPTMIEHYTQGNEEGYKADLSLGLRNVIFITLPASVGLIALRVPLVRALYYQGNFTAENVNTLSMLILFYSIGIVGYCCRQVLLQGFYSIQETAIPVRINIFILVFNVILSSIFVKLWEANGLALAYSLAGIMSMCTLAFFLRRRVGQLHGKEVVITFLKSLISAAAMFAVITALIYVIEKYIPMERKLYQLTELGVLLIIGVSVYFLFTTILGMKEQRAIMGILKRKLHIRKSE